MTRVASLLQDNSSFGKLGMLFSASVCKTSVNRNDKVRIDSFPFIWFYGEINLATLKL